MSKHIIKYRSQYFVEFYQADVKKQGNRFSPFFKDACVFNTKKEAELAWYSICDNYGKHFLQNLSKDLLIVDYDDELKRIEDASTPKETWVFVRKDKKAFLGFDKESDSVVLNANGYMFPSLIYQMTVNSGDNDTIEQFLIKVNQYLRAFNKRLKTDQYIAIRPSQFLKDKKYRHLSILPPNDKKDIRPPITYLDKEPQLVELNKLL